jgi:hypothetical protein
MYMYIYVYIYIYVGVRYDSGETPRMMCKRGIKENEKVRT